MFIILNVKKSKLKNKAKNYIKRAHTLWKQKYNFKKARERRQIYIVLSHMLSTAEKIKMKKKKILD